MTVITDRALELAAGLARKFEGLRLEPYHDPAGYPTIGNGHKLSDAKWAPLNQFSVIDEAEAERLLEADLRVAAGDLERLVHAPLRDGQQAALIDFIFNLGARAFEESTLRRKVNAGLHNGAVSEFGRWIYAKDEKGIKRVLPGLIRRRAAEADLYLNGGST